MIAAQEPSRRGEETRLLVIAPNEVQHARASQLQELLRDGDVLVVNRSATLPSSFRGTVHGQDIELRLAAYRGNLSEWFAVTFGGGDWRWPTERRGLPPPVAAGDQIQFSETLYALVEEVIEGRLLKIRFHSPQLGPDLYAQGRPIQYSYLNADLEVWDQQTLWAGPPISVEAPSASFPFTWRMILDLRAKGVKILPLLHGAGLSSTGSADLDARLPLEEWYDIPELTARVVNKASGQVVALGTTVLRALESAAPLGQVRAGAGRTTLRITPDYRPRVVTGLISGMHEPGSSHLDILRCFAGEELLARAYKEAASAGYLGHEYGDLTFVGR